MAVCSGVPMKKILLALTAIVTLTGSAVAADLPIKAYTKAPPTYS